MHVEEEYKQDLLTHNGLQLQGNGANNWKAAGSWARGIAIVFIAVLALSLLLLFAGLFFVSGTSRQIQMLLGENYNILLTLIALLVVAVFGLLAINLLRFGSGIVTAVNTMDVPALEKSTASLKYYFIVSGILSILGALYTLLTLFK